ncbi:MAG: EscU/YscU/HrcU family type III secretion system export apparatus switch protein [Halieaceae bacterium]|jgi:flagellar biosynthesis protein|nr:EscU/YscU/HrcU family type III secretion system export apparatus switch protein [Halieaceae bacterium]
MTERDPTKSVALRYDGGDGAPQVVASGEGEIAALIKLRAEAAGVPVVEDPRLAFLLSQVPLGDEIPPPLYRAVAEVLVFVMQMELAVSEQV